VCLFSTPEAVKIIMTAVLWTVIGFFSGSLMFSAWLARWALRTDLHDIGDGNPGATNVMKAGGKAWGALALLLDMIKGVLPVALPLYYGGLSGWEIVPVALAPVLGHAFSPWMRFNGGKAMAVTGGVWIALTLGEGILLGALVLIIWFSVVRVSGWAVALTFATMFVYFLMTRGSPMLGVIMILNAAIVLYKYRADLRQPPGLRSWAMRMLGKAPAIS
jgi:glycerol-3-phosphate acyltransferase PlsY